MMIDDIIQVAVLWGYLHRDSGFRIRWCDVTDLVEFTSCQALSGPVRPCQGLGLWRSLTGLSLVWAWAFFFLLDSLTCELKL